MIEIGTRYVATTVVDSTNVASAVGSGGLDVFATPSMVALMEKAAMLAVAPFLAEGETTVGGHISTSHVAPSPMGATIEAEAVVTAVEGKKIEFEVEARCDGKTIGRGTHLRFVVDAAKFLARMLAQ
ncbi:MAG: thioesterase family protein [Tidjanibacter sp.]|nr:thioesterase family protein [Tidjanibacter sp.]